MAENKDVREQETAAEAKADSPVQAASEIGEETGTVIDTEKQPETDASEAAMEKESTKMFSKKQKAMLIASAAAAAVGIAVYAITGYVVANRNPLESGAAYVEKEQYEDAAAAYLTVLETDVNNADAQNGTVVAFTALGNKALNAGNSRVASAHFLQALTLAPQDSTAMDGYVAAQIRLGQSALEAKEYSVAADHFERALDWKAESYEARRNAGQAYQWLAEQELDAAREATEDDSRNAAYHRALTAYEQSLRYAPGEESSYTGLAEVCSALDMPATKYSLEQNHDETAKTLMDIMASEPSDYTPAVQILQDQLTNDVSPSGRYYGELNDAGMRTGKGCVYYLYGGLYYGDFAAGVYDGQGVTLSSDGTSIYEGGWKEGVKDGTFVLKESHMQTIDEIEYLNQVTYEGEYVETLLHGAFTISEQYEPEPPEAYWSNNACCSTKELQFDKGYLVPISDNLGYDENEIHVYTCPEGHEWFGAKVSEHSVHFSMPWIVQRDPIDQITYTGE